MQRQMLTVAQVATLLGLSTQGTRNLIKQGVLPCIQMGKIWRIEPDALDKYLAKARDEAEQRAFNARMEVGR